MSKTMIATDNSHFTPVPRGKLSYFKGKLNHLTQKWRPANGTSNLVAFPEPRSRLRKELNKASLIGQTPDGKHIYLFDYRPFSSVIRELGRLRELSFRAVGEGTMKARDLDQYDSYYRHIILWDDVEADIVGSYRIGDAAAILQRRQLDALYTHELFTFSAELIQQLQQGLELGRSFIQPKYWGKRSLDYLWQGIGAYLNANPHIRYLFGAVSISDDYPDPAKALLTHFYSTHYSGTAGSVKARTPFQNALANPFVRNNIDQDFKLLKSLLSEHNKTVPILFKHYADFVVLVVCAFWPSMSTIHSTIALMALLLLI